MNLLQFVVTVVDWSPSQVFCLAILTVIIGLNVIAQWPEKPEAQQGACGKADPAATSSRPRLVHSSGSRGLAPSRWPQLAEIADGRCKRAA